jgi:hypothetical protein
LIQNDQTRRHMRPVVSIPDGDQARLSVEGTFRALERASWWGRRTPFVLEGPGDVLVPDARMTIPAPGMGQWTLNPSAGYPDGWRVDFAHDQVGTTFLGWGDTLQEAMADLHPLPGVSDSLQLPPPPGEVLFFLEPPAEGLTVRSPDGQPWTDAERGKLRDAIQDCYGHVEEMADGQSLRILPDLAKAMEAARDSQVISKRLTLQVEGARIAYSIGTMSRHTEWGTADMATEYAPGVVSIGTPGHGGFYLDASINATMPDPLRIESGYYEEDLMWSRVAAVFPEYFEASAVRQSLNILKDYDPDTYMAWKGVALQPWESLELARREIRQAHARDYVTHGIRAGRQEGAPDGHVLVLGRKEEGRGEEHWFLVPHEDYRQDQTLIGFIVDPRVHPQVTVRADRFPWAPRDQMESLVREHRDVLPETTVDRILRGTELLDGLGFYGHLDNSEADRVASMLGLIS